MHREKDFEKVVVASCCSLPLSKKKKKKKEKKKRTFDSPELPAEVGITFCVHRTQSQEY